MLFFLRKFFAWLLSLEVLFLFSSNSKRSIFLWISHYFCYFSMTYCALKYVFEALNSWNLIWVQVLEVAFYCG